MPKFSVTVQKLWLDPRMKAKIKTKSEETHSGEIPPGNIISKGDWMALTYLQTNKYSKFNHITWEEESTEISNIKAAKFKLVGDKIMIIGGKRQIGEINSYLMAITSEVDSTVKMNELFVFEPLIIDLGVILSKYEQLSVVKDVSKVKIRDMEVSIGNIDSCTIKTANNYDGVKE